MKKCKKLFKSSSHFGSRKSTPKMGVGAVVIAKMNEAKRWCPFWGSGNDSQNGSRILCVLWKAWLGISTPEMKICNRKPLNSDLKTLLQSVSCFLQFKTQKWHSAVETLDCTQIQFTSGNSKSQCANCGQYMPVRVRDYRQDNSSELIIVRNVHFLMAGG